MIHRLIATKDRKRFRIQYKYKYWPFWLHFREYEDEAEARRVLEYITTPVVIYKPVWEEIYRVE